MASPTATLNRTGPRELGGGQDVGRGGRSARALQPQHQAWPSDHAPARRAHCRGAEQGSLVGQAAGSWVRLWGNSCRAQSGQESQEAERHHPRPAGLSTPSGRLSDCRGCRSLPRHPTWPRPQLTSGPGVRQGAHGSSWAHSPPRPKLTCWLAEARDGPPHTCRVQVPGGLQTWR